jgi:hypothetical protein
LQIKFLRQRCPEKESQSLSLIYRNGERSLDLICSDKDQAEYWYLGLRALLPAPCSPCSSIGSRSSRQIDSCTNTPRSYIQLKSRLPSVHSTPRHIQVHPSHRNSKTQGIFSGGSVDYSEALFYPRQRTLSDIDTYLEKLTRKVPNPDIHGLKNIVVNEIASSTIFCPESWLLEHRSISLCSPAAVRSMSHATNWNFLLLEYTYIIR